MTAINKQQARRRSERVAVLATGLVIVMLGATAVQAARNGLTLGDVVEDPSLLFGPGGVRFESLIGLYPELEVAPGAADAAIDRLGADIALPLGGDWAQVRQSLAENPTFIDELGLRSMLEQDAACQWTGFWVDAFDRRDTDAVALATGTLVEVPRSPVLAATDGGGSIARMQQVADAAQSGDVAVMRQFYTAQCDRNQPPPGQ